MLLIAHPEIGSKSITALTRSAKRGALVVALAVPMSAFALVGGVSVAPDLADSPWAGVGSLKVGANFFTATLIAPGYVLTAAHVAKGARPQDISFQTYAGNSYAIGASQVFVNPEFTGDLKANDLGDPSDLAIIKLSSDAAADVPIYKLFDGQLGGAKLTFVSYAGSTTNEIVKKTGENIADSFYAKSSDSQHKNYIFDYDTLISSHNIFGGGPLPSGAEASLESGDSGSAAFVLENGQWKLAGINTNKWGYNDPATSFEVDATGGSGVVLLSHASWINSVITPVPEPTAWLMLLAGLGVVSKVSVRSRSGI